jgi:hypothetical protein
MVTYSEAKGIGKGVAAMIGTTGPKELTHSVFFAEDGLHFSKTHHILNVPRHLPTVARAKGSIGGYTSWRRGEGLFRSLSTLSSGKGPGWTK